MELIYRTFLWNWSRTNEREILLLRYTEIKTFYIESRPLWYAQKYSKYYKSTISFFFKVIYKSETE